MGCSHTIIPASEGHLFACPGSRIGSRVRWIRLSVVSVSRRSGISRTPRTVTSAGPRCERRFAPAAPTATWDMRPSGGPRCKRPQRCRAASASIGPDDASRDWSHEAPRRKGRMAPSTSSRARKPRSRSTRWPRARDEAPHGLEFLDSSTGALGLGARVYDIQELFETAKPLVGRGARSVAEKYRSDLTTSKRAVTCSLRPPISPAGYATQRWLLHRDAGAGAMKLSWTIDDRDVLAAQT